MPIFQDSVQIGKSWRYFLQRRPTWNTIIFICRQTGPALQKKLTKSLSAAGISSAVYSWKHVHLHQKRSLYDCTYIGLQCCWIINGAITTFVIKWNCDRLRIFAIHSLGAFKAWGTSQKDQRPFSQRGLCTSIKYLILPLMKHMFSCLVEGKAVVDIHLQVSLHKFSLPSSMHNQNVGKGQKVRFQFLVEKWQSLGDVT